MSLQYCLHLALFTNMTLIAVLCGNGNAVLRLNSDASLEIACGRNRLMQDTLPACCQRASSGTHFGALRTSMADCLTQ